MKKFFRSINQKLQKDRVVVNNGKEKRFDSLIKMSDSDRIAYVINAMNSCDEDYMTPRTNCFGAPVCERYDDTTGFIEKLSLKKLPPDSAVFLLYVW